MGAKREYTAVFAIGAKLLSSFKGVMSAAQARMRGLQAAAKRASLGVSSLKVAMGGLLTLFGTFVAGKIFAQIFGTASDEAVEARQRTRSLMVSLRQMEEIRARGKGAAEEEIKRIYAHNQALEEQGVLQKDLLDDMAVVLARAHLPAADIQKATDKLADLLVATAGVNASQEQAVNLATAFKKAVSTGKVMALQKAGVDITKEQAKAFSEIVGKQNRVNALMKILGDNYKDVNKEARNTPEGRIQVFRNLIKNMAQDLGEKLLPAQAELADAWKAALPELAPLMIKGFTLLLRILVKLGNFVRTQLIPWWHEFQKTERFRQIVAALGWIEKHFKAVAITAGVLVGALVGLSIFSSILPAVLAIISPVGLIVAGVLALAAAVLLVWYNWDKVKEMFPATAAVVEHFIEGFKLSFQTGFDFVKAIWKTVYAILTGDFTGVGDAWSKVWHDMVDLMGWWKTSLIAIAKAVGQAFKDYFLRVFEDIKSIWTWMKGFSWSGIKKMFAEGKDAATAYGQSLGGDPYSAGGAAANAAAVAPMGAAAANIPLSPEGLAKVQAERAAIIKDLQRPELRNLVSATLATEADTAEGQKNVAEALVNRAVAQHQTSAEAMIKGGFYGPYNRGETAAVMSKGLSDARSGQVKEIIDQIGAGRNALRGMTDQGMVNEIKGYKENVGGEYYGFMEGLGNQFKTAAYLESQKAAAPKVAHYAGGGIVDKPTLGLLGEAGPEAVVPLRGGGGASVHFNPIITINGDATPESQAAMDRSLRDLAREFVANFKRAQGHERRLSYEGGYG